MIAVTGAGGFVGRHATAALTAMQDTMVTPLVRDSPQETFERAIAAADVVVHCAGVNRTDRPDDFTDGNVALTERLVDAIRVGKRVPTVIYISSYQAGRRTPYGLTKAAAESVLRTGVERGTLAAVILRCPGIFGKWSRPDYNSVVATFCHRLARGIPIIVDDPTTSIDLMYIDDVTRLICDLATARPDGKPFALIDQFAHVHTTTVGHLAAVLTGFRDSRADGVLPDVGDPLVRRLWSTWLSFLPPTAFAYPLTPRRDPRGSLAELFRSERVGQLFVSRTLPGIVRGQHWHHSKAEKFVVVEGDAMIRLRPVDGIEILEYRVRGDEFTVVDIPPGYVHNLENVGTSTLVVLFWASEPFDPAHPDTFPAEVQRATA